MQKNEMTLILLGRSVTWATILLVLSWGPMVQSTQAIVPPQTPPHLPISVPKTPLEKLDINTASAVQLQGLPGMGAAYAARIIRGRPYVAKNQLAQRGILSETDYGRIKDLIIARHPK